MRLILTQPTLSSTTSATHPELLKRFLRDHGAPFSEGDLLLLPEHWYGGDDGASYLDAVRELAVIAGCHVVGGSQHERRAEAAVNTGLVVDRHGRILTRYEKLRPYALERQHVEPGQVLGEFEVGGRAFAVFICADFWFSDLFDRLTRTPDVVLVPALSVTRKPSPDYSRALWRQLATTRAYEFAVYVGVSDWAATSTLPPLRAAGVAGFSDPTGMNPESFFSPVTGGLSIVELDFEALDDFRRDRRERGFLWDPSVAKPSGSD